MIGTIVNTLVYPIKGLHGIETHNRGLQVNPQIGVVGDRNQAVYKRTKSVPDSWKPKGMFWVCMNLEGMATETGFTEADLDTNYRLAPEKVRELLTSRGVLSAHSTFIDTGGNWHLSDNNRPYVSFLNLASVRELEKALKVSLDPRRFRMNIWVEGLDPWVELEYANPRSSDAPPRIQAGCTDMVIDSICTRCKAIEQSPSTGKWDIDLQSLIAKFLQENGYQKVTAGGKKAVMGWFAIPNKSGKIFIGDKVYFCQ